MDILRRFKSSYKIELLGAIRRQEDARLDYWMKNPVPCAVDRLSIGIEHRWWALVATAKAALHAIEGDWRAHTDSKKLFEESLSIAEEHLRRSGVLCYFPGPEPVFLLPDRDLQGMESLVAISEGANEELRWVAILWTWHWLIEVRGLGAGQKAAPVGFAVRNSGNHPADRGGCGSFILIKLPLAGGPIPNNAGKKVQTERRAIVEAPWSWTYSVDHAMALAILNAAEAAWKELTRIGGEHAAFSWHFEGIQLASVTGAAQSEEISFGNLGGLSLGAAAAALIALTSHGESYDASTLVSAKCDNKGNLGPVEEIETKLYSVLRIGVPIERVIIHPACVPARTTLESGRIVRMREAECTLQGLLGTLRIGANLIEAWRRHLESLWKTSQTNDPAYLRGMSRAQLFVEPTFRSIRMRSDGRSVGARRRRSWNSDESPKSFGSEILPGDFELIGAESSSETRNFLSWKDVVTSISSPGSRSVIIAPSGYGKTLLVLNASVELTKDFVPIPVNLTSILPLDGNDPRKTLVRAVVEKRFSPSLPSFAESAPNEDHLRLGEELEKAIQNGRACIFLDGFDEVSVPTEAYALIKMIATTNSRLVVLTREYGLSEELLHSLSQTPNRVPIHHVQPLTQNGMNDFLQKYFVGVDKAEDVLSHLSSVLLQNTALEEVTSSPLLLTFASFLAFQQSEHFLERPERTFRLSETTTVSELYEEIALLLLENVRNISGTSPTTATVSLSRRQDALKMLEHLSRGCFDPFVLNPKRNRLSEGEIIAGRIPSSATGDHGLIEMMRDGMSRALTRMKNSGLLIQVGEESKNGRVFAFAHRSFLEYLAARACAMIVVEKMTSTEEVSAGGEHVIHLEGGNIDVAEALEYTPEGLPTFRRSKSVLFLLLLLATQCEPWSNCLGLILEQLKGQARQHKTANYMAGTLRNLVRQIVEGPNTPDGPPQLTRGEKVFLTLKLTDSCWSVLRHVDSGLLCAFARAQYSDAAWELGRCRPSSELVRETLALITCGNSKISDAAARGARSLAKSSALFPEYLIGLRGALAHEIPDVRRSALLALDLFPTDMLLAEVGMPILIERLRDERIVANIAITTISRIYVGSSMEAEVVAVFTELLKTGRKREAADALQRLGRKIHQYPNAIAAIKEVFLQGYTRYVTHHGDFHTRLLKISEMEDWLLHPDALSYMVCSIVGGPGSWHRKSFAATACEWNGDLIQEFLRELSSPIIGNRIDVLQVLKEIPQLIPDALRVAGAIRNLIDDVSGESDEERSFLWNGVRMIVRLHECRSDATTLHSLLLDLASDPNVHVRHAVAGILQDIAEETGEFPHWDVLEKLLDDEDWGVRHVGVTHILRELGEEVADQPRILAKLHRLLPSSSAPRFISGPQFLDFRDGTIGGGGHEYLNVAGMIGRLGKKAANRCPQLLDALLILINSQDNNVSSNAWSSVWALGEIIWQHVGFQAYASKCGRTDVVLASLGSTLLDDPMKLAWACQECEFSSLIRHVGSGLLRAPDFEERIFRELGSEHSLETWKAIEELGIPISWVAARFFRGGPSEEHIGDDDSPNAV